VTAKEQMRSFLNGSGSSLLGGARATEEELVRAFSSTFHGTFHRYHIH
jgi:hypothetical protein